MNLSSLKKFINDYFSISLSSKVCSCILNRFYSLSNSAAFGVKNTLCGMLLSKLYSFERFFTIVCKSDTFFDYASFDLDRWYRKSASPIKFIFFFSVSISLISMHKKGGIFDLLPNPGPITKECKDGNQVETS